MRQTSAKELR
jgi:Ca2+-binding EF-hand superfamily protein